MPLQGLSVARPPNSFSMLNSDNQNRVLQDIINVQIVEAACVRRSEQSCLGNT
jgi:hypothetical protein